MERENDFIGAVRLCLFLISFLNEGSLFPQFSRRILENDSHSSVNGTFSFLCFSRVILPLPLSSPSLPPPQCPESITRGCEKHHPYPFHFAPVIKGYLGLGSP